MAMPSDNKPIVCFIDAMTGNGNRSHVSKFDTGTTWIDLGYVSPGTAIFNALTLDTADSDTPIVAYTDYTSNPSRNVVVKKWSSGTTWTSLGVVSTGSCEYLAMAFDPTDNKPIVAFNENNNRLRVMKWNSGTTWKSLGVPILQNISDIDMTISSAGVPFVIFTDVYMKTTVMMLASP